MCAMKRETYLSVWIMRNVSACVETENRNLLTVQDGTYVEVNSDSIKNGIKVSSLHEK